MGRKRSIAIIGAGNVGTTLAQALSDARYQIFEIVHSGRSASRIRARFLADRVGSRFASVPEALLAADLVWFCVPDRAIRTLSENLAQATKWKGKVAFHSSGALPSTELAALARCGAAIASLHPLMTFVPAAQPSLVGVPFAGEGDPRALRVARQIVQDLHGNFFRIPASRKPAYHAWGAFTSPLLIAMLIASEEVASAAGIPPRQARKKMLPILMQTLANYAVYGPARSFSGPIIRGDVATVERHLRVLAHLPRAREIYLALAREALASLPAKNRSVLTRLLHSAVSARPVRRK